MHLESATDRRGERLAQLTHTSPGSTMGKLLRMFWQPVAVGDEIAAGSASPLRILGEDLTLYRGESGRAHLIAGRCAHRSTLLHTGWVAGDRIRCMYHGWTYDGGGRCTERPAERDAAAPKVAIAGYPVEEYAGLIFAYLGEGEPPAFELPRKDAFERAGPRRVRKQVWDCNWFQMVENSFDAVHVSFVHALGRSGTLIQSVTQALPELEYCETESGLRQTATRGPGNVRVSNWTFPNNNHIISPGPFPESPWIDTGVWNVPVDDDHTARFLIHCAPKGEPEVTARLAAYFDGSGNYNPAEHYDALFLERRWPEDPMLDLASAQDYVAQRGQGVIVDRSQETLGRSDAGIALLRKVFLRELDALRLGEPTKRWRKLERPPEMPMQQPPKESSRV